MQKSSIKYASYLGKGQVYLAVGFTPEQIKVAFINEGLSEKIAEELVKEAWGAALARVAPWLAKTFGSAAGGGAPFMQKLLGGGGASKWLGGILQQGAGAVGRAATGMAQAPWKTFKSGLTNVGRGFFFSPHAQGIGGLAGKGLGTMGIVNTLFPGGQPQAPQLPPPNFNSAQSGYNPSVY
jgi:hypothetical protein